MRKALLVVLLASVAASARAEGAPVVSVTTPPALGASCSPAGDGRVVIMKDSGVRWCCGGTWAVCPDASDLRYRRDRVSAADATSLNDGAIGTSNEFGFNYGTSSGLYGPYMSFGGLNGDPGGYHAQLSLSYQTGNEFKFRTFNGDTSAWNPWHTVWNDGRMGAGSGLDADMLDGMHASSYPYFRSMFGGVPYESLDLNALTTVYEARFLNLTGTTNKPSTMGGSLGYYFGMGGGDVTNRGVQLLANEYGEFFLRERSTATWNRIFTSGTRHALTPGGPYAGADLNAPTAGFTYYDTNTTNRPSDYGSVLTWDAFGSVDVAPVNGRWIFQMAWDTGSPNPYLRQNTNGGGWTAWSQVYTASNFASAYPNLGSYDVGLFFPGKPTAAQVVARIALTRNLQVNTTTMPASKGVCGTNPSATATWTLSNATLGTFGQVTISTTCAVTFQLAGTYAQNGYANLNAGDPIVVTAGSSADSTLADVGLTLQTARRQ